MANITRSKEGQGPGFGAWILALLSLVLFGALSWFSLFAGLGFFQVGNLERAQDKLLSSDLNESRRSLSLLARPPALLTFARLNTPARGRRNVSVSITMLEVLERLDNQECDKANEVLGHFLVENKKLLSAHSLGEELLGDLKDTGESLKRCASITDARRESQEQLKDTRIKKANFEKQYASLAEDFAAIFGLQPSRAADGSINLEPYVEGALQGLPRVTGIRDGIPNLFSLKSELDKLGTAVRVGGADTHQLFLRRLEEARNSTSWTVSAWQNTQKEEEVLQTVVIQQEEELKKLITTSRKKLSFFVYRFAKTEVDPDFIKLSSFFAVKSMQLTEFLSDTLDNFFLAMPL